MRTIAVDLGGTRIKLATVEQGKIVACEIFPTDASFAVTRTELEQRISRLMASNPGSWQGLGICTPGFVDEDAGCVRLVGGKHAGLVDFNLKAWARAQFNLPAVVLNDARAALLGEVTFGCAKGERDAVIVTLGTGVGTAVMSEGRLPGGRHNTLGLLGGHTPVKMDGRPCACGGRGCFEAYVGTWALKEMTGDSTYDYRRFEADYHRGEPRAVELFKVVSEALGTGVVQLVHAYDAEAVVFSGGASRFTELVETAQAFARAHAFTPWGAIRFSVAADPEVSGLLGVHARVRMMDKEGASQPC